MAMPRGRFFIENPGWLSGGSLAWFIETFRLAGVEELNALAGTGAAGRRRRHLPAGAFRRHGAGMGCRGPRLFLRPDGRPWRLRIWRARCWRAAPLPCATWSSAWRRWVSIPATLLLLGGGARSRVWAADPRRSASGRPAEISGVADSSPVGAGLLAAVAAGAARNLDEAARRMAPPTMVIAPDPGHPPGL